MKLFPVKGIRSPQTLAGSLHNCDCHTCRWVLLATSRGLGENGDLPCDYRTFYSVPFTLTRDLLFYWEQGSLRWLEWFSVILPILGEVWETTNERQSGCISVWREAATPLVCSALPVEWKYLLLLSLPFFTLPKWPVGDEGWRKELGRGGKKSICKVNSGSVQAEQRDIGSAFCIDKGRIWYPADGPPR